jgi:hypothetical protein
MWHHAGLVVVRRPSADQGGMSQWEDGGDVCGNNMASVAGSHAKTPQSGSISMFLVVAHGDREWPAGNLCEYLSNGLVGGRLR